MATNPEDIRLTDDYRRRLAKIADQKGTSWQALLDEAVKHIEQAQTNSNEVDLVDIAAKCLGSFSQDLIDDRKDRL